MAVRFEFLQDHKNDDNAGKYISPNQQTMTMIREIFDPNIRWGSDLRVKLEGCNNMQAGNIMLLPCMGRAAKKYRERNEVEKERRWRSMRSKSKDSMH